LTTFNSSKSRSKASAKSCINFKKSLSRPMSTDDSFTKSEVDAQFPEVAL
ncbi:hypothetical protein Tco_1455464, partial [Tanacetum coccineum]